MRLAVLSDIHGNAVGLEAVLDELALERVDAFVCLGDVSEGGPQPVECADRIRELGCPVVNGNCDGWLCDYRFEPELAARADIGAWAIELLGPERLAFLATFEPWVELEIDDGRLLCVHGTRDSNVAWIDPVAEDDELDRLGGGAQLLAHGHTHLQWLRRTRRTTVFNPGRIGGVLDRVLRGMNHDLDGWAQYAVVAPGRVELRRARYDVEAYRRAILASGMPHVRQAARRLA